MPLSWWSSAGFVHKNKGSLYIYLSTPSPDLSLLPLPHSLSPPPFPSIPFTLTFPLYLSLYFPLSLSLSLSPSYPLSLSLLPPFLSALLAAKCIFLYVSLSPPSYPILPLPHFLSLPLYLSLTLPPPFIPSLCLCLSPLSVSHFPCTNEVDRLRMITNWCIVSRNHSLPTYPRTRLSRSYVRRSRMSSMIKGIKSNI